MNAQQTLRHHVTGAIARGEAQPIVESSPGPRRVRLTSHTDEQIGRVPGAQRVYLIEFPRVSSGREGKPDIWEWRLARGLVIA